MYSSSSLLQSINKFTTYMLQLCACGMQERETRERDQRDREGSPLEEKARASLLEVLSWLALFTPSCSC